MISFKNDLESLKDKWKNNFLSHCKELITKTEGVINSVTCNFSIDYSRTENGEEFLGDLIYCYDSDKLSEEFLSVLKKDNEYAESTIYLLDNNEYSSAQCCFEDFVGVNKEIFFKIWRGKSITYFKNGDIKLGESIYD